MARTLTSANSVLAITVPGLYNSPQVLQGYSTDDMFSASDISPVDTVMGADGKLSAGFTPVPVAIDITLQGDSLSNDIFDTIISAQNNAREVYPITINVSMPATGKKYATGIGYLTTYTPFPGAKKTLQPRKYTVTVESISPANA